MLDLVRFLRAANVIDICDLQFENYNFDVKNASLDQNPKSKIVNRQSKIKECPISFIFCPIQ
jgi:hypothetical protein